MGHRRVGTLPKTYRWREIVSGLGTFSSEEGQVESVVAQTIEGVRDRFRRIEADASVNASFEFLVALAVASQDADPRATLSRVGIDIPPGASALAIARTLDRWVAQASGSGEYEAIAKAGVCDALSAWQAERHEEGPRLFGEGSDSLECFRKAATGSGFCELSRLYFAKFTERYLRYFLDREASSAIETLFDRDSFDRRLEEHVNKVSRYAFETAKITQSFAAGWFNKHARHGLPSRRAIRGFLSLAFGKLREELRREGTAG